MIKDKTFSQRVLEEAEECFTKLNGLLLDAQRSLPESEFKALRRGIGFVLGYLYTDVQAPIYKAHPELEPPELRKNGNGPEEI